MNKKIISLALQAILCSVVAFLVGRYLLTGMPPTPNSSKIPLTQLIGDYSGKVLERGSINLEGVPVFKVNSFDEVLKIRGSFVVVGSEFRTIDLMVVAPNPSTSGTFISAVKMFEIDNLFDSGHFRVSEVGYAAGDIILSYAPSTYYTHSMLFLVIACIVGIVWTLVCCMRIRFLYFLRSQMP